MPYLTHRGGGITLSYNDIGVNALCYTYCHIGAGV